MTLSPTRSPWSKSLPLAVAMALGIAFALLGCSTTEGVGASADDASTAGSSGGTSGDGTDGGKPPLDPPAGSGFTCEVQTLLATKCQVCHTDPPAGGATAPLMTVAQFLDWSKRDPSKLVAEVALARMQDTTSPMPPAFFNSPVTPADVAAFKAWVEGNFQGSCNGAVPVLATCTTCHGDAPRVAIAGADPSVASAPPHGTKGESLSSTRAVGAHEAHVNRATLAKAPLACTDCHIIPTSMSHSNNTVEIGFGPLAKSAGANPTWNGTSCEGSYCHGKFPGGTGAAATWTGAPMTCGSCHGAPPPTPYHSNPAAECSQCHGAGYSATAKTVDRVRHMNGVIDSDQSTLTCSSCHGDAARVALAGADPQLKASPPLGTKGETLASTRAVGAHQAHVNKGSLARPVACNECHLVPISNGHSNNVVDIAFGTLAKTKGAAPAWNGTTCTASYCHGNFPGGQTAAAPSWTGGAMACNGCHGTPPATPPHGNPALACSTCHGPGYSATAQTVNTTTHINGVVNVDQNALTCSSCHGDAKRVGVAGADVRLTAAPPLGSKGETAASARAVGAHLAHANQTTFRNAPLLCSECHVVPVSNGHSDGVAQVAFGALAKTGGAAPVWNGATCSAVYCHGSFPGGSTLFAPSWTGGTVTCGSCHATPPQTGDHRKHSGGEASCADCHGAGYVAGASVDKALHINGKKDVAGAKIKSYNPATRLCSSTCHGNETW